MKNKGGIVKVGGPYRLGDAPCPGLLFPDPDYSIDIELMIPNEYKETWEKTIQDITSRQRIFPPLT